MTATTHHSDVASQTVVLLNPAAGGGTALLKWESTHDTVRAMLGDVKVIRLNRQTDVREVVHQLVESGHTCFVAAGGDGTVNALVHALMTATHAGRGLRLGAIALGSSNDYHKPVRSDQLIDGISCKIDFNRVEERDVGVVGFEDERGQWQTRHWIVNAGLGITADANAFFNRPDGLLEVLKRSSTATAILYAALRTMIQFHSAERHVKIDSEPWNRVNVTNLGIVKSPHFSGNFSYDSGFDPSSGRFHVHLCENMSLLRTLYTLWELAHERFSHAPHTKSWQADHLLVLAEEPFPVEFDGEVVSTSRAAFILSDRRLEVCV